MICDNLANCPIFKNRKTNSLFEQYSDKYCLGFCESCKRYVIRIEKGMEAVPKDLLPDGQFYGKSIFD